MIRTNPNLWEQVKEEVLKGDKGGNPNEWSARKAQLAVRLYKSRGGGYKGKKPEGGLTEWTKQNWRTKSGKPSLETGERYLPEKVINKISESDYKKSTEAKRKGMKKGIQYVKNPESISEMINKLI